MFGIDAEEDSMADILNNLGIETYTFDNTGIGPVEPDCLGNNPHQSNIDRAVEIITQHQIDYVLCYSYGCLLAPELLTLDSIKGLMLLDPCPKPAGIVKTPAGNGKIALDKKDIEQVLQTATSVNDHMRTKHLTNLCAGDVLTVAEYPVIESIDRRESFLAKDNLDKLYNSKPLKVFFTSGVSEKIQALFPDHTYYPTASHWILLENERYQLANDIVKFVEEIQNDI